MSARALSWLSIVAVCAHGTVARADAARIQHTIEAGHRQSDEGKFCEAWRSYHEAAAEQESPSPEVWFALARAAYKAGMWDQAIVALHAFLRSEPDDNAKQLATSWLSESELHVVRCQIVVDGAPPANLDLTTRATRPEDAAHPACTRENRVVVDDRDGPVALLGTGWSYEVVGQANGKPLQALQIYLPSLVAEGANSCSLELHTRAEHEVAQPAQSVAIPTQRALTPKPPSPVESIAPPARAPSHPIPTWTYIAWGTALVALAGTGVALWERESQVNRWNSDDCLGKKMMTRAQTCPDLRDGYQSAGYWALGTGIGAAAFASLGGLLWFLDAHSDKQTAQQWSCQLSFGSGGCSVRF